MDIQSLTHSLSKSQANKLEPARILEQLLAQENKNDSSLKALVIEVNKLSTQEQQKLLARLTQELASLSQQIKKQGTASIKPPANSLSTSATTVSQPALTNELQTSKTHHKLHLLKQGIENRLSLVESALQNKSLLQVVSLKIGKEQIKTLMTSKLEVGQRLELKAPTGSQTPIAYSTTLKERTYTPGAPVKSRNLQSQLGRIAESLRQHLPMSTTKTDSVQRLMKANELIRALTPEIRNHLVSESIQKLISKLENNILSPETFTFSRATRPATGLIASNQIKQSLTKSGSLLESTLRQLARTGLAAGSEIKANATNTETQFSGTSPTSNAARTNLSSRSETSLLADTPKVKDKINEQDTKALLLKILELISSPASNKNAPNLRLQNVLQDPLLAILKCLGIKTNNHTNTLHMQTQLHQEIKHLTNATLARIQTLQLRSLSQGLNETAQTLLPALELSFRVNDNVYPLIIYFQEKLLKSKDQQDEEAKDKNANKRSRRQWKVFMQFEMKDCGWFASEVSLLDEQLSTRFWAEKESTKKMMKPRLEDLKNKMQENGIQVEEILLASGAPPSPHNTIQQHLVDIQT